MERYDGFIYIIGKDRIGYTGIKWYNVDENGMRKYIYIILGGWEFRKMMHSMEWVGGTFFGLQKPLFWMENSG